MYSVSIISIVAIFEEVIIMEGLVDRVRKIAGWREQRILARLLRIEQIFDYTPYFGIRFYGRCGDYFEVVDLKEDMVIMG